MGEAANPAGPTGQHILVQGLESAEVGDSMASSSSWALGHRPVFATGLIRDVVVRASGKQGVLVEYPRG
eukprot:12277833-Alexandrium_andersonii.AAC.1